MCIRDRAESINQTLERRLSFESLKWRIEGWRTGRDFGEIVLTRSLGYRVEQVFLVHRETGLLLQHVARSDEVLDSDMVSGMLTAIQDFVRDSFGGKGDVYKRQVFRAFQYRDFRLMWFGACTSSIGTWMQIVALSLIHI